MTTTPILNACNFKGIEEISFKADIFHKIYPENQFGMSCNCSKLFLNVLVTTFFSGACFSIANPFHAVESKLAPD